MVMYMKTIGQKIQEIRNLKNFPQKHVASLLGVQRPNYSKIENDKQNLTPQQIKILCEFFDVSADYLLDIEVNKQTTISHYEKDYILKELHRIIETITKE